MPHQFHSTVLREYDIRGVIGETLGPDDARAIGRGFGTLMRRAGGKLVAVGYDGRVSSPMLEHALIENSVRMPIRNLHSGESIRRSVVAFLHV